LRRKANAPLGQSLFLYHCERAAGHQDYPGWARKRPYLLEEQNRIHEVGSFSDQRREPIVPTFGPAVFNRDILALDVLEILQSLAKCGDEFRFKGSR